LPGFSFSADDLTDTFQLLRHSLIGGYNFIECVGDLALDTEVIAGHPHRKIAASHRLKRMQQILQRIGCSIWSRFALYDTTKG
jgi:hypothetical protein